MHATSALLTTATTIDSVSRENLNHEAILLMPLDPQLVDSSRNGV